MHIFARNSIYCDLHTIVTGGRDSSVGVQTRYRLDGTRIESRCGQHFPWQSTPAPRPKLPPVKWQPGLSWGVKRPGRDADHPPQVARRLRIGWRHTSATLLCLQRHVMGWPLPFNIHNNIMKRDKTQRNYSEARLWRHRFMPHLVYSAIYSVVPINSSLLTITYTPGL
jgi:hypothetical protein